MKTLKKLLIFIFAVCSILLSGQTNKTFDRDCYKVYKIDDLRSFYLIFLRKGNEKYTIYSEKTITSTGRKVEVDSTYFFELSRKVDTLSNGVVVTPMNYADIYYFDRYPGEEIGMLCTAKNLKGLFLLDSLEIKKR